MKWTNEKPKTPGFYFRRRKDYNDRVVEVYQVVDSGELWVVLSVDNHCRLNDLPKCLWSDVPVNVPDEV